MSKRVKIIVHGRVQRVGYRDMIAEIARKLKIKGIVRNLEDEISVEIIAEGDEGSLKEFQEKINIQDSPIDVETLDIKEEEPTGEFEHFKIQRGDPMEEIGERMDVAGTLLYDMNKKQDRTVEILDNMNKKQDETVDILRNMDKKQDETIHVLKDFSKDTNSRFDVMEEKYGAVSQELKEISKNLKSLVDVIQVFKPKD